MKWFFCGVPATTKVNGLSRADLSVRMNRIMRKPAFEYPKIKELIIVLKVCVDTTEKQFGIIDLLSKIYADASRVRLLSIVE